MNQLSIEMGSKPETYLQKTIKTITKRLKKSCKRIYVRSVLFSRKMNERGQEVSDTQKYIMSIARMAINHPDTEFPDSGVSGKRYLKNETVGIYIIFYKGRIEVTNHIYHYDVIVTDRNWARILMMYNDVVDRIRLDYEEQIMSQVKNSLSIIRDKMVEATNKK